MEEVKHKSVQWFLLSYEIRSSWWAGFIPSNFLQNLVSDYFIWKVEKKYKKYLKTLEMEEKYYKERGVANGE